MYCSHPVEMLERDGPISLRKGWSNYVSRGNRIVAPSSARGKPLIVSSLAQSFEVSGKVLQQCYGPLGNEPIPVGSSSARDIVGCETTRLDGLPTLQENWN